MYYSSWKHKSLTVIIFRQLRTHVNKLISVDTIENVYIVNNLL